MIEFINNWSKRFAKIWLIGFIAILSFLYVDSAQDSQSKHSWPPVFTDINLLLPFALQKTLNNKYNTGCVTVTKFPFERFVVGYRKYKNTTKFNAYLENQKITYEYIGCFSGKKQNALVILLVLLLPFIGLNYVLPWLARTLSSAGKSYKSGVKVAKINTEKNYLKAYKEVESDKIKSPELWAKAFAISEGNKVKQKSIYVELRTKQLDEMQ